MSTIKWKIIPILLITAYLLLGCIGCSSYSSEEKDATDLTGDTLKPSNIGEISFDISEIGNMPLMTEFYICPANGTIEIKYAEGAWSNLKVDLYDRNLLRIFLLLSALNRCYINGFTDS